MREIQRQQSGEERAQMSEGGETARGGERETEKEREREEREKRSSSKLAVFRLTTLKLQKCDTHEQSLRKYLQGH